MWLFAQIVSDTQNQLPAESTTETVQKLIDYLSTNGTNFLLNLVAALAIFYIGKLVAKWVTSLVRKLLGRANVDETLIKFAGNVLYALLLLFVIMAALERIGVDTTSFAAIVAATGFAIGLALQGSLSNFAAGVMLIIFKPFQIGDYIEAGGISGIVYDIQIFNTIFLTGDNKKIIVPNNSITSATIINYSAMETRRVDLVVGCGYNDDLKAVKQFLEDLILADERILQDPAPLIAVDELADSSVNFVVRPWVKAEDYWPVKRELTEQIKLGFDQHGFTIPYPSQDIYTHQNA